MSASPTCSASSLAAGEPLAGTASEATSWLLVEVRGAWGKDAVADSGLPPPVRAALDAFPGKVILIRRPDRRSGVTLIRVSAAERGATALRQELGSLGELPAADIEFGVPVSGPIVLVCAHGRRDACCARLGPPLFDALTAHLAPDRLWQSSHLGGHRFAPNLLALPNGVQLGRIPVARAREVAELLSSDRIPLDLYRGRTIYTPPVQAAEVLIRLATCCDGLADLQLASHEGDVVTFSTPVGELAVRVAERRGLPVPGSCGAAPEPTFGWEASLESKL